MDKYEITEHIFLVGFLETENNKSIQEEIASCVKSLVNELNVTNARKTITRSMFAILDEEFAFAFNLKPYLAIVATFFKEDSLETISKFLNNSLDKLYEKNWKELSKAFVYYEFKLKINKGIELISPLINKDKWEKLFGNDRSFSVKRLEIWQPPAEELRQGFYLAREHDELTLRCIRSDFFKDKLPRDIASRFLSELKKQKDSFLGKIDGDKC